MTNQELHYYKDSNNNTGVTKSVLENPGDYVEITKEEYDAIEEEKKQHILSSINSSKNEKLARITELKTLLRESDYKQAKWLDGDLSDEDYAPIKKARHEWRAEINRLEEELNND